MKPLGDQREELGEFFLANPWQQDNHNLSAYERNRVLLNAGQADFIDVSHLTTADLESDSLQKLFYKQRFNLDTLINDTQMADTTLKVLGELLFESGRYDYVIPEQRFLSSQGAPPFFKEMPWTEVEQLCETFQTDAVLSLDHIRTRVITRYKNETFYDPFKGGFSTGAHANMKIYYETLFRVYDPVEKKIVLRELLRDTLYWEDVDISPGNLFKRFTPVKQALSETGIVAALELSDKIAIRWRPEYRSYFIKGNEKLRKANELAIAGDWQTAISEWMDVLENSRSKGPVSKAQFNIALAYEILGDIDLAIYWALESYNTMYRPLTYKYLEILKKRRNELRNRR